VEMNTKQEGKNPCWKKGKKKLRKAESVVYVALHADVRDEHPIDTVEEKLQSLWGLLQGSAAVVAMTPLLCMIVSLGATLLLLWVATT
jgi:hypothetical protein